MESTNLSAFHFAEETREKLNYLIEPLVQRTYQDPAFKAEFMENPLEVIRNEAGIDFEIPEKSRFVVIDKSDPHALYITLPVNEDSLELTDEELELIAGGTDSTNSATICLVINLGNLNLKKGCKENDT